MSFVLPSAWQLVTLDTLVAIKAETLNPQRFPAEQFELFSIPAYDSGKTAEIAFGEQIKSNKVMVQANDILFSKLNPRISRVWKVPVSESGLRKITSTEFWPIQVRVELADAVDTDFIALLLTAPVVQRRLLGTEEAATKSRSRIRPDNLLRLAIPLPPSPEQRRIVAILRPADVLCQLRRQANARARDLLPALFSKMFGSNTVEKRGWDFKPLSEFGQVSYGLTVNQRRRGGSKTMPYLRVANVQRWELDLSEIAKIGILDGDLDRFLLQRGDVLVVEGHANPNELGRAAEWNSELDECLHQNHLLRVRPYTGKATSAFLMGYINSAQGRQYMLRYGKTSSGLNTINSAVLADMPIPDVPFGLQKEFEYRYQAQMKLIAVAGEFSSKGEILFRALLARAFTGELTSAWRAAHAEELAAAAAERDRLLAQQDKAFYTLDADTGRVATVDASQMTRAIAEELKPAIQAIAEGMAANRLLQVIVQTAWQVLAERLRPAAVDFAEMVSLALSEAMSSQNADMIGGLAQAAQPLAESIDLSLAEAARDSTNSLSLVLARDAAEIAAQIVVARQAPAPQLDRPVRKALDISTLGLLQAAEAGPAYFLPKDFVTDGRDEVEAEEGLQLLAALGFVRRVWVRGQHPYRLVDPAQDGVLSESRAHETG
jgi:type I restriction enzyme, S subunit